MHIAHNCIVGNGVTMSNLAQLAGHVDVGDYATIGGQAGVHQFTRIGRYAMVGGASKLTKDVPPFFLIEGNPAQPYGLNSVGLAPRRLSPSKSATKSRSSTRSSTIRNSTFRKAIEAMKAEVTSDPGREIIAFLEAPSERGVLK